MCRVGAEVGGVGVRAVGGVACLRSDEQVVVGVVHAGDGRGGVRRGGGAALDRVLCDCEPVPECGGRQVGYASLSQFLDLGVVGAVGDEEREDLFMSGRQVLFDLFHVPRHLVGCVRVEARCLQLHDQPIADLRLWCVFGEAAQEVRSFPVR